MRHVKFSNIHWTSLQDYPSEAMDRVVEALNHLNRGRHSSECLNTPNIGSKFLIVDIRDERDMKSGLDDLRKEAAFSAHKRIIICDDLGTKIFSLMKEFPEILALLSPSNPLLINRLLNLVGFGDSENTGQGKVIWEISIRQRQDCEKIKAMIADSIKNERVFDGFSDDIVIVANELLSNAFFNAPFDPLTKTFLFKKTSRESEISLGPDQEIEVSLAEAKEFYSVRVKDPFGSLERTRLLENLERAARKDHDQLRIDGPGSGVGLYTIFEIANEICIETHARVYTSIECRFIKTTRKKDLAKIGKNFVIGR